MAHRSQMRSLEVAGEMDVRLWEPGAALGGRISRFLEQNKIRHTRVSSGELGVFRRPALSIDGHIYVDPNDHALRRLLGLN